MMPTRDAKRSVRNGAHLPSDDVVAASYLRKKIQLVPASKPKPSLPSFRSIFSPIANDGVSNRKATPSPVFATDRKAAPSPALTAATEAMSDCSFTTRSGSVVDFSPENFGGGFISPILHDDDHIDRVVPTKPIATKPIAAKPLQIVDGADEVRKTRIKTELCMHYKKKTVCPFGEKCTYAHSEEELQMTKLVDLHRAGLIDSVVHYRSKPCYNYTSCGSCPFGIRCQSLHDPRCVGQSSSWLPVTETQGNSIQTDLNVESVHQKRGFEVLHDNPFGSLFSLADDGPKELYELVCNMNREDNSSSLKRHGTMMLEMHKISIALQMQGSFNFSYKFRPQCIISGELCMELQKRAFRLTTTGQAVELELKSYDQKNPSHVLCREIAFGPDSDPSVKGVSLWFSISDEDVKMCTPQQAKRFRWKRGLHNKNKSSKPEENAPSSIFDRLECFVMIRPMDPEAFRLCSKILEHRLAFLQTQHFSATMTFGRDALKTSSVEILNDIGCHIQHWKQWAWPINEGRNHVDEATCVPAVDGHYYKDTANMASENPATTKIWESFVTREAGAWKKLAKKRLSIFVKLARGEEVCRDRNLPHIRNKAYDSSSHKMNETSDKCWQSCLLESDEANDWDIILSHFSNSRSKKVLGILQK